MAKPATKPAERMTNASVFIRTDLYIAAKKQAQKQELSTSRFIADCVAAALVRVRLKPAR